MYLRVKLFNIYFSQAIDGCMKKIKFKNAI